MTRMPRKLSDLEEELADSKTALAKAEAHFALAVFHDNNSREAAAIPHYVLALKSGLQGLDKARAHAYLASSLWKVGKSKEALKVISDSERLRMPIDLANWIGRLKQRVLRSPNRFKVGDPDTSPKSRGNR